MKVQTACTVKQHIMWVQVRDGLNQADQDSILLDVESSGCPRCLGQWALPIAPTIDCRAYLTESEIAGRTD